MSRTERLKQIGEELRGQFQKIILDEKLLNDGEMIEMAISIKPAPTTVSCVINDPQQTTANEDVLKTIIPNTLFGVRVRKSLRRLDIKTFGDLIQRSGDDLMETNNFGTTSLHEVREKLAQHGLKLKGDK